MNPQNSLTRAPQSVSVCDPRNGNKPQAIPNSPETDLDGFLWWGGELREILDIQFGSGIQIKLCA
jgi:hypothetical protein